MDWVKTKLTTGNLTALSVAIGLRLVSAPSAAQEASSLTEANTEIGALKGAPQNLGDEAQTSRAELLSSDALVAELQKSLSIANSESEVFRRQSGELKLRLEALGFDGASTTLGKLEQRLLRAASDFMVVEVERKVLRESLILLSESVLTYQKSAASNDADARLSLEVAMRGAAKALGVASPGSGHAALAASNLSEGLVISIKDDLSLVVANLGAKQGVKVGMPFKVLREGGVIGNVQVVDVRENIAGAVVQQLNSERNQIKVGDHLKVDAR